MNFIFFGNPTKKQTAANSQENTEQNKQTVKILKMAARPTTDT